MPNRGATSASGVRYAGPGAGDASGDQGRWVHRLETLPRHRYGWLYLQSRGDRFSALGLLPLRVGLDLNDAWRVSFPIIARIIAEHL